MTYKYNDKLLTQYCRETGTSYSTVYKKIIDGYSVEDAVKYAQQVKNNFSHSRHMINGVGVIDFMETNYKRPITAYLRYSKLKSEGYSIEEILQKLEKYK